MLGNLPQTPWGVVGKAQDSGSSLFLQHCTAQCHKTGEGVASESISDSLFSLNQRGQRRRPTEVYHQLQDGEDLIHPTEQPLTILSTISTAKSSGRSRPAPQDAHYR